MRRVDRNPGQRALINWNPMVTFRPGVYGLPQFDVHFYLRAGPRTCRHRAGDRARNSSGAISSTWRKKPIPSNDIDPELQGRDAVAPAMGNHLIGPHRAGVQWPATSRAPAFWVTETSGLRPTKRCCRWTVSSASRTGATRSKTAAAVDEAALPDGVVRAGTTPRAARNRVHGGFRAPRAQRPRAARAACPSTALPQSLNVSRVRPQAP